MQDTNAIYHHGMKGMHWGKRNGPPYPLEGEGKAALKEQRQEQKETRKLDPKSKAQYQMYKAYNKQRAKNAVRRDVAVAMIGGGAVGTAIGGPVGGLSSMLASGLATTAFSSAVNTGRNIVNNSKYKNMLLESQEFKAYSEKGEHMATNVVLDETKSNKVNSDQSYDGFSIIKTEGNKITAKGKKGSLSNKVIRIRNLNNIHGEELIKLQKICRDFPEDKVRDILVSDKYDNDKSVQSKFTREEFKKKYTVGGLDVLGPSEKNKTTSLIIPMNPVEDYIKDADYRNSPYGDMNFEIHTDLNFNKPKTYS